MKNRNNHGNIRKLSIVCKKVYLSLENAPAPDSRSQSGSMALECPTQLRSHSNGAFLQLVSGRIPECSIKCGADKSVSYLRTIRQMKGKGCYYLKSL